MSEAMAWSWVRVSCLVLLFSGYLAAAVNKDIPEAAAVTPSLVTLTKFAFKEAKETGERLPETKYASLDVCFTKELEIADDEIYTLLYTNDDGSQMTEYNSAAPVVKADGAVCVTFANTKGTAIVMPPDGQETTYNLHIASQTEGTEQMGEATFILTRADYGSEGETYINCDEELYTRNDNDDTCTGGQLVGTKTCYKSAGPGVPSKEGCLENSGFDVCLSDMGTTTPDNQGTASVTSLSYTGGIPATGADLVIEYKDETARKTNLEMIMQEDIKDPASFYVSACTGAISSTCAIDGYSQGAKTYQVCAVNVGDQAAVTTTNPGKITDLNLAATQYGDKLEFGFNNARPADGMYYSATVDDGTGSRTAVPVGINCNGVLADYTCYGFLDIALLTDGDLLLTVEYGVADDVTGDVSPAGLNTIIGTYTKTAL